MENGKVRKIFDGPKMESQLEWLSESVLRPGDICSISVAADEEQFDLKPYLGKAANDRIERFRNGNERSLTVAEMAMACGKQQVLELLMCLYAIYGRDIDMNALLFIGMTLPRLLQGPVGYVYAEWARFELQENLHKEVSSKAEDLRRQLHDAEKACFEEAEGRKILDQYRNVVAEEIDFGITCYRKELSDEYPMFVLAHSNRGEYGPIIKISPKDVTKENKEGLSDVLFEAKNLSEFRDMNVKGLVRTTACIDSAQKDPELGWVQPPKFDWDARVPPVKSELYTAEDYQQMVYCVDDNLALELVKVNALEDQERTNKVECVDQPIDELAKSTPSTHFKKSIDIHSVYQDIGLERVLGVVWRGDRLDRVERVIITSPDGMVLMNQEFRGMAEDMYAYWMYSVRSRALVKLAGTTVYGFNVTQHLSKLGLGGMKNKLVDMLQLPQLKGKYPSKSIENYQLRYFRTSEELVGREDPVLDNVLFCAFLVRRWGMDWKHRRRRRMIAWRLPCTPVFSRDGCYSYT